MTARRGCLNFAALGCALALAAAFSPVEAQSADRTDPKPAPRPSQAESVPLGAAA